MKSFFKIRNEAYADMLSRKEKLHNRSHDAYKKGDLPTMNKAHSLAMKQNKRIQAKYPDEDANRIMSGASKDYQGGKKWTGDSVEYPEDTNVIGEDKRGLWDNIHAKRKRIKAGSGERMRKPGSKGAPTARALKVSAESTEFDEHLNGVAEGSLNELSKDTLKSYAKKAVPDMQASQKRSEIEAGKAASTKDDKTAKTHYDAAKQARDRTEKRMAGISGAIKRVTNQGVAEATGDVKFDKMLKGITSKKEVTKQQKTDTKQQARDAFSGMFGGGNPADKLSIRKKGAAESSEVKEGIMDFMSNTPAKSKSKLSLSAMREISRRIDAKNKLPKISRASNDTENTNAHLRFVRAEGVKELMSNTLAKPKARLSLSAMKNISRKTDAKNKMSNLSKTTNEDHKKDDIPFDGPYKKTSGDGTVKDKSGAVHTPMSRVKHLARQAMKQQMKEDIDLFFEAKDKEEYDYEGDMARGQLRSIISNAQRVHDMLEDNTNIAEWVQSKITLAEDYISTVANYMMSEIDEAKKMKGEDPCWDNYKMIGTKNKGGKQVPNCVPEEVELDENWVVHKDGKILKAGIKQHKIAKAHAEKHGAKVNSAEWYQDNVSSKKKQDVTEEVEHADESRQVYYINSHKNQDPAVAQAKRIRKKMSKPKMLNLKMGEAYSARDRLAMALNNEKKKREDHEAAQAAREAAAKQSNPPEEKIKEGIASLISKNIKPVTATKLTPQQKADIRLNK